ncbi:hypothetical protein LCGC14_2301120 [marine sediment metagenome]|uniref:Uncharacterized protein n=1 Tax=marine sediment metagenome TaxID=412755 RepID=A0A0F9CNG6_9ZZZZ
MGSYYDVQDTLDKFIAKLKEIRKEVGGGVYIQTSKPRTLLIPYERDELDKGIQLHVKKNENNRIIIHG